MLTNTEKCLAYNQCKRMVQITYIIKLFIENKCIKKTKKRCAFQMHFPRTQLWVLRLKMFLSFTLESLCTFSAMTRNHCFYSRFQKYRQEQEQCDEHGMQCIHPLRSFITFIIGKPKKKERKQTSHKRPGLKRMVPASGKF